MATLLPSISVSSKISNSIIDIRGWYDISCQIWILHIVVWCIYWMLWVCTCIHSLLSNFIEGVGLFSRQTDSSCFLPSSNISSPRLWMKLNPLLNQRCPLIQVFKYSHSSFPVTITMKSQFVRSQTYPSRRVLRSRLSIHWWSGDRNLRYRPWTSYHIRSIVWQCSQWTFGTLSWAGKPSEAKNIASIIATFCCVISSYSIIHTPYLSNRIECVQSLCATRFVSWTFVQTKGVQMQTSFSID